MPLTLLSNIPLRKEKTWRILWETLHEGKEK